MSDVEERAHRNFCNWTRWNGRADPGAEILDEGGVLAIAGPIDFPTARTALRTDRSRPVDRWSETVDDFFTTRGKTACVHTRVGADDDLTERLLQRGFREWTTTPEMVCEAPIEPREPAAGITVRFADSPADISAYASIAAQAFAHLHLPPDACIAAVDRPDAYLGADSVVALAELDGTPVAGAHVLCFDQDESAYVAWVACADVARGRGLGDTVTRAVTREAFRRGANLVTLEASPFGEHTYARMGYREIYRYRMLLRI